MRTGVYLYTKDQKLIDSVSSWWSVIHGYKHPVINQAIISQVEKIFSCDAGRADA